MDKNDKNLLELLGIKVNNDQIVIDFEKAKSTLKDLKSKLDQTATKIKNDLEEGKLEIPAIGIDMTPQKIEIDLKQTKESIDSLLEKLSNLATVGVDDKKQDSNSSKEIIVIPNESKKYTFFYFEIESQECSKDQIAKELGIESSAETKYWRLSTPKVEEESNPSKMIQNLTKTLLSRVDELLKLKEKCNAKFTLGGNIYLKEGKIFLEVDTLKFLAQIDANFSVKINNS
jgi:hypothetical protein